MGELRKNRAQRRRLGCASKMPPLRHSIPGEPFDIMRSEAAEWLCSQPEIRQWVFDMAHEHGLIVYDRTSGTWNGKGV